MVDETGRAESEMSRESLARVSENSDRTELRCWDVDSRAVESIWKKAESDASGITISCEDEGFLLALVSCASRAATRIDIQF